MDIGKKVAEVIPYKDFREKIKITKENLHNRIEIHENYIIIF